MQLPPPDYPAPAKLNLFLHVVGRRADGYHLLQSAFTLVDLHDTLRFRVRADGAVNRVNDVPGVPAAQDLVVRAALLLKEASGTPLGADIEVDKRIPIGGGLGGGSSDAATTLLALGSLWKTGFDREALAEIGADLGADVPFFVFGRNAWA
ncbi:MAG TPA: 4-(cytidine 5'-diphospho)-2-C-methyl-D-erythritol kinase, partial [Usitatibacter sp.]|nr:4-(cytidine 5'-diphospho)-2-C-methyl-D-erythritol kinase [Usitatibacter sp.]